MTQGMSATPEQRLRMLLAVLPGVMLVMLHAAMIDLPKADIIDALDTDRYRFHWITGSYLLGNAAGMLLTSLAAALWGLRRSYCLGLLLFSLTATLCGTVSEVIWMAPLRLFQGMGAGLVICSAMVLLWRGFAERKPTAMAWYGAVVFLAVMTGIILAGFLTHSLSWRCIFFLNGPLGLALVFLGASILPSDVGAPSGHVRFDLIGFLLFLVAVLSLNVVLDLGQYWGWTNSPAFVPWLALLIVSGGAFVLWGVLSPNPITNLRPFGLRNYGLGLVIKALFSINLYVLLGLLAAYQVNLRGYQWWQGALVFLPPTLFMALALVVGARVGRKRAMVMGLAIMAGSTWLLSAVDLYTSKYWLAALLAVWGAGAGMVVVPVMRAIFEGLPPEQAPHSAFVYNMMRHLPAYIVAVVLVTLLTQRTDAHFDRLRQNITYNRPLVSRTMGHTEHHFADRGSSPEIGRKQTHALLGRWVHANARAYALQTILKYLALAPALAAVLVVFLRR